MKFARIHIDGKSVLLDASGFARARDAQPKAALDPTCKECGQRVFLNDEKGAKGFRIVNLEITKRGQQQKMPGFSHYKGNADKDCPLYFADDPRFQSIHRKNEFDALERERNLAVLNKPHMRDALADVQRFYMHRLTGHPQIAPEDRKCLDNIEKKMLSWTGLADHPWVLGYIGPVLIGSRKKQFAHGVKSVEYKGVEEQLLAASARDGEERFLCIPRKLQLCFSRKNGKEPTPLLRGGRIVEFVVSREEAYKIAKAALEARREAARAAEAAQAPSVASRRPGKRKAQEVPGQFKLL